MEESYDAIVVGSGISGGWAAKELTERGLRVLMLDRGRMVRHGEDYPTEHEPSYEMKFRGLGDNRRYHMEYPGRPGTGNEASGHFFANTRDHPYTTAPDRPFKWTRGNQVGGKSLMWARQSYRYAPINFEENALDGHGVDWPVRYSDIEPWYDRVEQFIGISGSVLDYPTAPGGKYFQPPMPMNPIERDMQARMVKAFPDRPLTMARLANLTRPIGDDRQPCHYCGPCDRGCSTGSYFSTQSSTLPAAMATKRLTVMADSIATRILTNETGERATGVEVMDAKTRQKNTYLAKIVFVCASALESVRLLLLSANEKHPKGLGNSTGLVGKYIMDHLLSDFATATTPGPQMPHITGGRPGALWMPRFRNIRGEKREDYVRGFQCNAVVFYDDWQRGARAPGIGVGLKDQLRQTGDWHVLIGALCEMLPALGNQVAIDPNVRDAWDSPVLRMDVTFGPNELAMSKAAGDDMVEMMKSMGYQGVMRLGGGEPIPGSQIHEMGGAVMGRDKRTSVLDAHNRSHDIPNLFVTDGAAMSSSSQSNPSITYMAFTARAAAFAASEFKAGRL
ncbi:MAG TPA: GMC family oxidoreductase [Sphingobium sp.]|uniref:GMC family oxidoreductase n=1 Tax=Sphingobium sp. TaxID=1912891 RepID=UPI002ED056CB